MEQDQEQKLTKKKRKMLRRQEREQEKEKRARSKKVGRFMIWGAVLLLLVGGLAGVYFLSSGENSEDNTASAGDIDKSAIQPNKTDWTKGNSEARVVLVEYGDFQCPACGSYYPMLKQLSGDFGGEVLFVYRHFPLKNIHRNAEKAGWAAEAAGIQGKFWEMHDMIFENQKDWSGDRSPEDKFESYAENIGLDIDKFKQDMESGDVKDKVEDDYQSGWRLKVNSTPSFFLNGEKISNPRSYDDFKELLEQKIVEAEETADEAREENSGNSTTSEQ